MEFRFPPEEEAFRQELRDFIRSELPADWGQDARNDREDLPADRAPVAKAFTKKLAQRGWLTLAWPKEYGGGGAGPLRQLVYNEETSYQRAPGVAGQGVSMVGPTLMLHGSDEQRRR